MPGLASDDDAGRGALGLAERQLRRMGGMNALYRRAASTAAYGEVVLMSRELEDACLFRLRERKVVAPGRPFTWFGLVTAFLTVLAVAGYALGVRPGLGSLDGQAATGLFLGVLSACTAVASGAGLWWFVAATGEQRLTRILDARFPGE